MSADVEQPAFSLAPRDDLDTLCETFRKQGAVSIPRLLPDSTARALTRELAASGQWLEIFRGEQQAYEMPQAAFAALDEDRKQALRHMIEAAARENLQYRYRSIRTSEVAVERHASGRLLDAFVSFLNSEPVLDLLRQITGLASIAFADGQATDYRAGDFLTTHDDAVDGKSRLAAYVFGLTREWRADWGGLLLFERGNGVEGFVPSFNDLRVFAVPTAHHVSYVAPWVEARRLSVTGWLRGLDSDT